MSGTVASNDSDIDSDPLAYSTISSVSSGQGVINFNPDGTYIFTPAINFNGVINIDYKTCDPKWFMRHGKVDNYSITY